jgi:transitional endoplasmic reticulum ATPase
MSTTADDRTASFKVAEALPKDVGRGLVRLDPEYLAQLKAEIGDVAEIAGKRPTVARLMPAYADQRGQGLIQMDGILRANAGAGLDEKVTVRRVEGPVRSGTGSLPGPAAGRHPCAIR